MKKSLLALAVTSALGAMFSTRAFTTDAAFPFRMGAGFPGDVNRTHPFNVMPGLMNSSVQAVRLYGDPVIVDTATNSYRGVTAADTATLSIDGVAVRPYPVQQTTGGMSASFGTAVPPTNQPLDVITDGYVMAKVNNSGTPTKKGAVYVYTAASNAGHVQGGFESAAGANLSLVSNAFWVGPPDAAGIAELHILATVS